MRKILSSIFIIALIASVAFGATRAYFSDTETSTGNTFSAGTLDLKLDSGDENKVAFTVTNMKPDDTYSYKYTLRNAGTISGYLDLEGIAVASDENGCNEPETTVGDTTCGDPGAGDGELDDLLKARLYWDYDCEADFDIGTDDEIYNDTVGFINDSYDEDKLLVGGGSDSCIVVSFDWTSSSNDNLGHGDSLTFNITFDLNQIED